MRILVVIPLNEIGKERLQSKMPEAEYSYMLNNQESKDRIYQLPIIHKLRTKQS